MTTNELLRIVTDRGFRVVVDEAGQTKLRGPTAAKEWANSALLAALRLPLHRDEIIRRFKPVRRIVVLRNDADYGEVEEVVSGDPTRENLRAACRERPNRQLALEHLMRDADGERWVRFGWTSWPRCDDPRFQVQGGNP